VVGRSYHIGFGGKTDFLYVGDTADAFIRAASTELPGAHVFNLHGETVALSDIVAEIEKHRSISSAPVSSALVLPAGTVGWVERSDTHHTSPRIQRLSPNASS
jgi:nucleoside-diphosphate-sugar epimerase